ncbi:hypothetical protein CVT26_006651 [Gymnopilus dilepis]|uniref:Uncharacterized protein n=1 Tax=Gymnopilus dilepis TaxID=231916 RepID=A0A409Y2P7_9AGAR|nr:hypothetical protein CVT26_006651 [Gymnopilus dilepis]
MNNSNDNARYKAFTQCMEPYANPTPTPRVPFHHALNDNGSLGQYRQANFLLVLLGVPAPSGGLKRSESPLPAAPGSYCHDLHVLV